MPETDEKYNFRFFYHLKDDKVVSLSDSELILDVANFYGQLKLGHLNPNQEYLLMRWSPGFECWTASKFNKFKAKEFLKSY